MSNTYIMINIPVVVTVTLVSAAFFSTYYLIHKLRKEAADKRQKMETIKHWVRKRMESKAFKANIRNSIDYYRRYSPELFKGLTERNVLQIDQELHTEKKMSS